MGGSSICFKTCIQNKESMEKVAIKCICKNSELCENMKADDFKIYVYKEYYINDLVTHKFISKCLGRFPIDKNIYALMLSYSKYKNLFDLKKKFKIEKISESLIAYISFQITESLQYLYNIGVLHLDIKPHNILVDEDFFFLLNLLTFPYLIK